MMLLDLQRDFRLWLASGSETAARRIPGAHEAGLAVYQNNYRAQLVGCLEASYPLLRARMGEVQGAGWECIGAFSGEALLGIGGYWIQHRFCYGRYLYVDHFIVDGGERGHGLGKRMWQEMERIARARGCERIVLDTFVTNAVAQRFWMDQGCKIVGFHFGKPLDAAA